MTRSARAAFSAFLLRWLGGNLHTQSGIHQDSGATANIAKTAFSVPFVARFRKESASTTHPITRLYTHRFNTRGQTTVRRGLAPGARIASVLRPGQAAIAATTPGVVGRAGQGQGQAGPLKGDTVQQADIHAEQKEVCVCAVCCVRVSAVSKFVCSS